MDKPWKDKNELPNILNFEEQIGSIILAKGSDDEGNPQWAYLFLPQPKMLDFYSLEESNNIDISKYGKILASGKGLTPPEEVRKEMKEKYGADESFEEEFLKEFEKVTKNIILDNGPNN